ncbi:MAG: UxaA family hydrolase, partial [Pirellulales bacterium]
DAYTLCGLLAGYINHPNVAGATVLSLGCQKAQIENLEQEIYRRNSKFNKPLYILEQQQLGTESAFMSAALKHTFAGLMQANECRREPAALSHLSIGLECGGSDGFSGISANPAIGHAADLTVALGGTVVLSEFPELAGAEQDLVNRAVDQPTAERFMQIMQTYSARAEAVGSGFDQNPSPGNVADGLTTDAIKSLGAAKKGGSSPVVDALDYPEMVTKPGLNLLCTPGGDIESVTAMVGSGANVVLFSTGLGTPTGNPIAPVLKVSSNNEVAQKMPDIIDVDAGGIINGKTTIDRVGEQILDRIVRTASGQSQTCAQVLAQDDFIPWKRGISI